MATEAKKLLFIHIPKTGGTSISQWMISNIGGKDIMSKHSRICDFPEHRKENYFCICRNPYERLLSWYFFRIRRIKEEIDRGYGGRINPEFEKYGLSLNQVLKEFYGENNFEYWLFNSLSFSDPYEKINGAKWPHANPDWGAVIKQVDFIDLEKKPKFILRTERLNQDFKKIQRYFNCNVNLDHMNKSTKQTLRIIIHKKHLTLYMNIGEMILNILDTKSYRGILTW